MQCNLCNKEVAGERLPRGWKRHNKHIHCANCWKEQFCIRAITIPVLRPLGKGLGWPDLRTALTTAWGQTTMCINWMTSQLYIRDELRMPEQEKLGKMPKIYLYPEARELFPDLPSSTVSALERAVKSKYAKKRYQTIWTGESSLPNARYPQPFVQANQSWKATYEPAGKDGGDLVPCVSLPLIGAQRWVLQLKGGKEFARRLADFKCFVDGTAIKGEIAISRKRVGGNGTDHGNGVTARDSGGQSFRTRVAVKMVGWFPKRAQKARGSLILKTEPGSFLLALDEKANRIRQWHCDHVRRWAAEHARQLQRWSDDQKCEQRPKASYQSRREAAVFKYRNRITSFQKEVAAQVTGVCRRRRFASVKYDDSCRDYMTRFDWSGFAIILANKLNEYDVDFERASDK